MEGGKNAMEREECVSCENVKEKYVTIKKNYKKKKGGRGRMEFAPAGAKGEDTAVKKESGC